MDSVLTEAFPCPALPCPCPLLIIDIDRCGADNTNLHPNRILHVIECFLVTTAFNSQLCYAANSITVAQPPAFKGKDVKVEPDSFTGLLSEQMN